MKLARIAMALAAPFLLAGCLLAPGRFTSSLDIRADRSFTFSYQGEVIAFDPGGDMTQELTAAMASGMASATAGEGQKPAVKPATPASSSKAPETPEIRAKREAIAVALLKEEGFRSVRYLGDAKFAVDYRIAGRLDRGFVFPFNSDAGAVIPWLAVEVRKDGTVRVKAAGFGNESSAATGSQVGGPERQSQGAFTLTTDATLVMHNNEGGTVPDDAKKVAWQVTPTSKTVPTAVIRF